MAIVGGGPTGVEMAAELTDLFDGDANVLFPHLKGKASVSVYDVAPQILAPFDQKLAEYATSALRTGKVNIRTNTHILKVTPNTIVTQERRCYWLWYAHLGYGKQISSSSR